MLETNRFRIIIIDDNPKIHMDFIKILAINEVEKKLETLRSQLFSSDSQYERENVPEDITIKMPVFEIETATQGLEGFDKITAALEEGRPFSLAIVDIRMPPGLDGMKTIKKIWTVDKDIQIIICSAYSDYSWMETIKELGIGDNLLILKKPFDNNVVRQMACALTRKWELARMDRAYISLLEKQTSHEELAIAEHNPISLDGVLVVSTDGKIYDANVEFSDMWGIALDGLKSSSFASVFEQMKKKMGPTNKLILDMDRITDNPKIVITSNVILNDRRTLEYYTQPHTEGTEVIGRLWCFRDITHQTILQKQWEYQATHDHLTNLANRILMLDFLKHTIAMSERNKTTFAVLFIDIDNFKYINDMYSHLAGDELLSQLAKRMTDETRASDLFARFGGDEFVFVAHEIPNEKFVEEIVERLHKLIQVPFHIAGNELSVSASIGYSIYPRDGTTTDELLHHADLAMYYTKHKK